MNLFSALGVYVAATIVFSVAARWRAGALGDDFNVREGVVYAVVAYAALCIARVHITAQCTILIACLAVSVASDLRSGFIYDLVTLPACVTVLALDAWSGRFEAGIAGAACTAGITAALHLATGGRGLGLGDVKLFLVVGAALTAMPSLAVIGGAFVGGAAILLAGLAFRRVRRDARVAFAPYIAAASVGVIVLGVR